MVNRVVVGAHYGLKDWLVQRVTALLMAIYSLVLAGILLTHLPMDYHSWKALFAPQWFRVTTFMFLLALFWHAWIGMRNILMDYVHPTGTRLTLQILVILSLLFYTIWAAEILWEL